MQRIIFLFFGAVLMVVFLKQPVSAQRDSSRDAKLRFIAEFAREGERIAGKSTLDVTFYGSTPGPEQAEAVLRSCLQAAMAMHESGDIVARAWHRGPQSKSTRQAVALVNGAGSLLYVTRDGIIRSEAGVASSSSDTQHDDAELGSIVQDEKVAGACKDVPRERWAILAGVAAKSGQTKHRHVVKAMREWCKGNNVSMSRDIRLCMSSISKAVLAMKEKTLGTPEDLPAAIARGADAYNVGQCGKCHQASGHGGPRGPDLTDSQWLHCDGSINGIREVLVSGVPRNKLKDANRPFGMNPVTNLISDEDQLTDLAVYVHSLSQR